MSSTRRRVVFLMTRPDQGLSLPRAYTNGIAWVDGMGGDGMGSEEFSSVRFDSLHFTDTPFSDDDDNNNDDDDDNDDA